MLRKSSPGVCGKPWAVGERPDVGLCTGVNRKPAAHTGTTGRLGMADGEWAWGLTLGKSRSCCSATFSCHI